MNEKPKSAAIVSDWSGQMSNADPRDIPDDAAQLALNVRVDRAGELITRGGLRELSFDILS